MEPVSPSMPSAAPSPSPDGWFANLIGRFSRLLPGPPPAAPAAAVAAGLGELERTYRTWRVRPLPAAWLSIGIAVPIALVLIFAGLPVLGLVLVPLAALGALAYALRAEPAGGQRWLLRYEHGFVDVIGDLPPRVVRWEWAHGPVESIMDGFGSLGVALDGVGPPVRITFDGLTPFDDLLAAVDTRVTPILLGRHRAAVHGGDRLAFGPLVVAADGVARTVGDEHLPWAQVESVRLTAGERLVIGRVGMVPAWFSGSVPGASTVYRLIMEIWPGAAAASPAVGARGEPAAGVAGTTGGMAGTPAGAAGTTAAGEARAGRARERRRRCMLSIAGLVALALLPGVAYATVGPEAAKREPAAIRTTSAARPTSAVPTPTPWSAPTPTPSEAPPLPPLPPLPETIYEYSSICDDGRGYSGAPRYGGRGPHRIHVDENFVEGLSKWYSKDPAKIQLIACVQRRAGRVLKKCEYFGSGKRVVENMILGRYTLTIRETRTGRVVGRARIDGADDECLYLLYNRAAGEKQYSVPTAAQIRQALRRYVE